MDAHDSPRDDSRRTNGDDRFTDIGGGAPEPYDASVAVKVELVSDTRPPAELERTPATAGTEMAPPQIGRYAVRRRLGRGGFGTVWLADDTELQRPVAIKVPRQRHLVSEERVEDFLREARLAAALKHPALVTVYDVGRMDNGACFVVMEYIAGRTLAEEMTSRRFDAAESARLIEEVAEAAHYAHTHGLVHRDIKPANILIDRAGRPHVVDFGLAIHEQQQPSHAGDRSGTPAYMAPEQVRAESHRLDGRTDIWALGIVLYELLARRRPFSGVTDSALFDEIEWRDPKPLRQIDDDLPAELERICLKCLSKRMADRFATAADLAAELKLYRQPTDTAQTAPLRASTTAKLPPVARPIPKGLRSFDLQDSDFFLQLLPGPTDRDGLPDSVRFWKTRVEQADADATSSVGMIYGPSGCGKSSLVKAGLLPRIAPHVSAVYLEATADETESRLLKALRNRFSLSAQELPAALAELRAGRQLATGQKVLIVLDQFEQWLHAHPAGGADELVLALRQCDGGRVQSIVMVRDDFWMAATRFMRQLEVPLVEGHNSAAVDLFPITHAEKVLTSFGQAFGSLPGDLEKATGDQRLFVRQAVEGLADDGQVICVRLALFADMVKGRPWTSATLKKLGGAEGVGIAFLEQTFAAASAPPDHRYHQQAARAVLKALLPESGSDIKGRMRSCDELLAVSGYAARPSEFHDLLRLLDSELRLIVPTDPAGAALDPSTAVDSGGGKKWYQLSHDYLVPSLREWLTRKQKETRRGRAELLLAERSADWNARRESRHLPATWQYLRLLLFTRRGSWSEPQRRMMRAATRRHLRFWTAAAAVAGVMLSVGWHWRQATIEHRQSLEAHAVMERLLNSETSDLPHLLDELGPYRSRLTPDLQAVAERASTTSKQRLHATLALLPTDTGRRSWLEGRALESTAEELAVVRASLGASSAGFFRRAVAGDRLSSEERFRAAAALAGIAPRDEVWSAVAMFVGDTLSRQDPLALRNWVDILRPIGDWLIAPLSLVFHDEKRPLSERSNAAVALAEFSADDLAELTQLTLDADAQQFAALLPKMADKQDAAIASLERELLEKTPPAWHEEPGRAWPDAPAQLVSEILAAEGMHTESFAICQTMRLADAVRIAEALRTFGYRPVCFRPYSDSADLRVAAAWRRDRADWRLAVDLSAEQVRTLDAELRAEGYLPVDVADYFPAEREESSRRFAALWCKGLENLEDARMYLMAPAADHEAAWRPFNEGGYVPRSNLWIVNGSGEEFFSSVRWKLARYPGFGDLWNADRQTYENRLAERRFQTDVRIVAGGDSSDLRFAGCWWDLQDYSSQETHGLMPANHLKVCRQFAGEGYRPAAVSVRQEPKSGQAAAASVWHRPVLRQVDRDRFAARQASAAIALARLGHTEELWPRLLHSADPRLRTYLIHRLAQRGIAAEVLISRLAIESDDSARRAILLALSRFEPEALPADERKRTIATASNLYQYDPDPGIHSAAELLLRRWQVNEALRTVPHRSLGDTGKRAATWFVSDEGQTMVVIRGPIIYSMGTQRDEPGRDRSTETFHRRRIGRSFAIGAKEIALAEFRRYDPGHAASGDHAPESACPAINVNWFAAARYCRWLSEREGIAESDMCFPPVDQIKDGMRLPADYLSRSGYRLPTEAEWEYVCRAGAETSRFYGEAEELLSDYAWTFANSRSRPEGQIDSQYRSWPVGTLMPNDLGVFDMLGNAMEWCQEGFRNYLVSADGRATEDLEDLDPVLDASRRSLRGGAFLYQPSNARCAHRDHHPASAWNPYLGFRVARTVKD